eukprot:TRINITY_DN68094_c12_g1_i1.p1 TRINITY_DN68094_c12_g1~~TRINITY_DN68094_c12_g1_i1.p1  ORF type:complete len:1074 (+),score=504.03 TRINITY_DN68094_c12_g1_i1:216-3224(+)
MNDTEPFDSGFSCPNNCWGHGICKKVKLASGAIIGKCACAKGFAGVDCSGECSLHCSGHGECAGQDPLSVKCSCAKGFRGPGCYEAYCADNCTGHGVCSNGRCFCKEPFSGAACELDTSCSGHGELLNGKCNCDAGYGGLACQQKVTCKSKCSDHGKCVGAKPEPGQKHVHGVCKCDDGWRGRLCNEKECPKGCSMNGVCLPSGKCECYSSFVGEACDRQLQCANNCTGSHGKCVADPENPSSKFGVCRCEKEWGGPDCNSIGCPNACHHHGKCIEGKCFCDQGFSGKDCSVECKNRCSKNGECVKGVCQCEPGFGGDDCSKKSTCPGHGTPQGECSGHGVCWAAKGECSCAPGFTGEDCSKSHKCGEAGCGPNGQCANGRCYCNPGFEGEHCQRKSECEDNCNGRGFCQHGKCFCHTGFTGERCEQYTVDPTCKNNCTGRGLCQFGKCWCLHGYAGDDCSEENLQEEQCYQHPHGAKCSNHGTCKFGKCFCAPGYAGKFCHEEEKCEGGCQKGQGKCMNGQCHCFPGYTGTDCSEDLQCPGSPLPCTGRGVCVQGQCACEPGYKGAACEQVTQSTSASKSCPNNCTDGGVCHMGRCFCVQGRDGKDCSIKTQDACPQNCNKRGHCSFGTCFCSPGFVGVACERSVKCSAKCLQNGVCAYGKCFCVSGWKGRDCDVRMDESDRQKQLEQDIKAAAQLSQEEHPGQDTNSSHHCPGGCGVNGICVNRVCACQAPYYGRNCEHVRQGPIASRCPNNCSGQGECLLGKCVCKPGFAGRACHKRMPMKCTGDCHGHGACHLGRCLCDPGFEPPFCATPAKCDVPCGKNGVCLNGKCHCTEGWFGLACNKSNILANMKFRQSIPSISLSQLAGAAAAGAAESCPVSCGANGVCVKGACYCHPGYTGLDCSIPQSHLLRKRRQHVSVETIGHDDASSVAASTASGIQRLSSSVSRTSYMYLLIASLSFGAGMVAVIVGQVLWNRFQQRRRAKATTDILNPLLKPTSRR